MKLRIAMSLIITQEVDTEYEDTADNLLKNLDCEITKKLELMQWLPEMENRDNGGPVKIRVKTVESHSRHPSGAKEWLKWGPPCDIE